MILVLGGTVDSREIVEKLWEKDIYVTLTTTTAYGKSLVKKHRKVEVLSASLSKAELQKLIIEKSIQVVIDATHPYATEISQNAISICKEKGIHYFRYQRKQSQLKNENIKLFDSYTEIIDYLNKTEGNIFLTTGSKNMHYFNTIKQKERLFVRVLPTQEALKQCGEIGISGKQIVAIQGPFSRKLNEAFYQEYNIKYLVTKDSGSEGGTDEKIQGAVNLGLNVLVIKRPKIDYPNSYSHMDPLIEKIENYLCEENVK